MQDAIARLCETEKTVEEILATLYPWQLKDWNWCNKGRSQLTSNMYPFVEAFGLPLKCKLIEKIEDITKNKYRGQFTGIIRDPDTGRMFKIITHVANKIETKKRGGRPPIYIPAVLPVKSNDNNNNADVAVINPPQKDPEPNKNANDITVSPSPKDGEPVLYLENESVEGVVKKLVNEDKTIHFPWPLRGQTIQDMIDAYPVFYGTGQVVDPRHLKRIAPCEFGEVTTILNIFTLKKHLVVANIYENHLKLILFYDDGTIKEIPTEMREILPFTDENQFTQWKEDGFIICTIGYAKEVLEKRLMQDVMLQPFTPPVIEPNEFAVFEDGEAEPSQIEDGSDNNIDEQVITAEVSLEDEPSQAENEFVLPELGQDDLAHLVEMDMQENLSPYIRQNMFPPEPNDNYNTNNERKHSLEDVSHGEEKRQRNL